MESEGEEKRVKYLNFAFRRYGLLIIFLVLVILGGSLILSNYLKAEAKTPGSSFTAQIFSSAKNFTNSVISLFGKTFLAGGGKPDYEFSLGGGKNNNNNNDEKASKSDLAVEFCSFDTNNLPSRETAILNEVAWMGTNESSNNEWIEIKNIEGKEVNLSGWQLINENEKLKVALPNGAKIPAAGFYILERKEEAVPELKADMLYGGALRNSNESLRLFDADCNLVDEVLARSNWPAGDNGKNSKRTMERNSSDLSWHTSSVIGGTPKKENSKAVGVETGLISEEQRTDNNSTSEENTDSSHANSSNESANDNQTAVCSQSNLSEPSREVLINEVAWAGTASNKTSDEWMELKNNSNAQISLSGWQLLNGDANLKIFFNGSDKLVGGGYFLLERTDDNTVSGLPADKIFTNAIRNSDESLRLFNSSCRLVDVVLADRGSGKNWPAGSASPDYRTAERGEDLSWHSYNGAAILGIFGTPKAQNSTPQNNHEDNNPPPPPPPPTSYAVTVSKSGSGQGTITSNLSGIDCGSDCSESYARGAQVVLSASTEGDSVFSGWTGACSGTGNCDLTMDGDKNVNAVFDLLSPPPPPAQGNVLISEIMVGIDGNSDYEFVELYNPTDAQLNLTGWSIKRKSASGQEYPLLTAGRFEGKIALPHKYFLAANDGGYDGSVAPDAAWAHSNNLAYTNNSVVLYNADGQKIEEVGWSEIPKGQSYERQSWDNAQFIIETNPNPQNSQS